MTPMEMSVCPLNQIDHYGTELGKVLSAERLATFISSLTLGFVGRSTTTHNHLAPEAAVFVHRMNDCVGVLDAMAHGHLAHGHKRQLES